MKKLLIILMVVAMASFLFVGCFGTTPDIPDVDEDVAVTGVTLDKATLALTVGDAPVTLVATVAPATATETSVIWASSDKTVAIVAAGVVTPLNAGISAITVTTVDGGFVATCVVTVTAADEPEPVLPPSTAPVIEEITNVILAGYIINLYSSDTQYMNADEVNDGILVMGDAPRYSEVNVYVEGIVVGTSTAYGVSETFTVFVAEDNLGDDGAKTLYATATEVALAESAHSTEYAFILDVVAPEMVKATADSSAGTITVTFDEAVDVDEDILGIWMVENLTHPLSATEPISVELISPEVVELEVDYATVADTSVVGDLIRVACETIEDLAGNETTDAVGYCYLELEE